jgi:hypothetical protein
MIVEMIRAEFADLVCVSTAQLSRWLADGTIGIEAVQGAVIRVDLALAMLGERLPPSPRVDLINALMRLRSTQAEYDRLPYHPSEEEMHARDVKNLLTAFAQGIRPDAD